MTQCHHSAVVEIVKRGWCDDISVDLTKLVSKCVNIFCAVQSRYELGEFLKFVQTKQPRTILEIGTARGGTLYGLSQLADPSAMLVSIDLPGGANCGGQTQTERSVFATFGPPTQQFRFIPADSRLSTTKETLRCLLGSRTLDLLFIDGDHSYDAVRSDFETYREFLSVDGTVVLHDICMFPEHWGPRGEVGIFWDELTRTYNCHSIINPNGVQRFRKSPAEAWAFGIGIVEGARNIRCPRH